jgi:hypothetical protein
MGTTRTSAPVPQVARGHVADAARVVRDGLDDLGRARQLAHGAGVVTTQHGRLEEHVRAGARLATVGDERRPVVPARALAAEERAHLVERGGHEPVRAVHDHGERVGGEHDRAGATPLAQRQQPLVRRERARRRGDVGGAVEQRRDAYARAASGDAHGDVGPALHEGPLRGAARG